MTEPNILGPKLTPPRGGLLRLQQSVQQLETRRFRTRSWMAAGVTASLATLAVLTVVGRNAIQQHRSDVAVQQTLTATPQTHFDNGAYQVLPSSNPDVQILLVGSLSSQNQQTAESLPIQQRYN
ncbi:MAG: hypothetical protein ACRESU_01355 [Gammaproteobacteria bacterium]